MDPILNIAANALATADAEMAVEAQNTANANTVGYESESVTVDPLAYQNTLEGSVATQVVQSTDPIDAHALLDATSTSQYWATQATGSQSLQSAFAEPQTGGIQETLNALQNAWTAYQSAPTSSSDATEIVSQAQNTAQVFNSLNNMLTDNLAGVTADIKQQAALVPSLLAQIATLNNTINASQPGTSQAANAIDQLNQTLQQLASVAAIQVIPEANGSVIVNSQNATLVTGTQIPLAPGWQVGDNPPAGLISIVPAPAAPPASAPTLMLNGSIPWSPSSGSLGGLLATALTVSGWQVGLTSVAAQLTAIPAWSGPPPVTLFTIAAGQLSVSPQVLASVTQLQSTQAGAAQTAINGAVSSWSALVGQVGAAGQLATEQSTTSQENVTAITQNFESQTSVDTNQAAQNLIQDQQAYSAAAQIMNIAQQTVNALLAAVQ